jgi:hypothetical protein
MDELLTIWTRLATTFLIVDRLDGLLANQSKSLTDGWTIAPPEKKSTNILIVDRMDGV